MNAGRAAALSFGLSILASLALVIVYLLGGDRAAEGVLLGVALGGLGTGIVIWATRLIDAAEETEDRPPPDVDDDSVEDAPGGLTRRTALSRLLLAAGGTLGAALAVPTLSLGPHPGESLARTKWTRGARVIDDEGSYLSPDDIPLDGVVTVFPYGHNGSGDSQTLLIKVASELLELPPERAGWAPAGCVAYSKICTHAGCPVGLYRAEAHELLCPCHQSSFDVLRGAAPVFGPAARPLPQLPLAVDSAGYLVARGDFPEPVGPAYWNLSSGETG